MIYADPNTGNVREDLQAPLAPHTQFFATPAEYHAWQVATFPPPPEVPVAPQVPVEVSLKQFRKALMRNGLDPKAINLWIDANITDPLANFDAHEDLEYSNMVERKNEFLNQMAVALGKTPEWVDTLFILAATLG
jgi:hypothetical protein